MGVDVTSCEANPDVKVALLSGRLDITAAEAASPVVLDALEQSASGLIVDLGGVDFVGSAGLRALLSVRKKADAAGKLVAVIRAQPAVYKIFKVSGLDAVFSFFEDEDEAVAALWP